METLDIFSGPPVYLRPFDQEHIPAALEWFHTDPDAVRCLTRQVTLNSRTTEEAWLAAMQASTSDYVFAVIDAADHRHVGTVGLHHIDPADRHGQVGIYLSPGARGQGNGRAALSKLVVWAFEVMNLHRLSLDVWSYNERAKRCYRDVGFVREGVLREAHYFGGRFWDVEMYGLLAEEYRSASGGPQAATASSPSVTPL